jgi:hypothetical protein
MFCANCGTPLQAPMPDATAEPEMVASRPPTVAVPVPVPTSQPTPVATSQPAPVAAPEPAVATDAASQPAATPLACTNCGAALEPGDRFCANCGTPVAQQTPATAAPTVIPAAPVATAAPATPAAPDAAATPAYALAATPAALTDCPACGAAVTPGALFCEFCGAALVPGAGKPSTATAPSGGAQVPSVMPVATPMTPASGSMDSPMLVVTEGGARLPLVQGTEMLVGREDPYSNTFPDVDLTPYGAEEKGVSRRHFKLTLAEGQYAIQDLGSTNYTFLNQQRLEPNVPVRLNDGDEIRAGRLKLQFRTRA